MQEVEVIENPGVAVIALEPLRGRLLAELGTPASAAGLSARLDLPRQKINYHLRALEAHGLVHVAEQKAWGGITERMLVATASSYVVSPQAMGPIAVDPDRTVDRLSASFLIALAARAVREVGELFRRATSSGKRLATISIDTTIRFRSAKDRSAFSQDLANAIANLVSHYHAEDAKGGREHRLIVLAHPQPAPKSTNFKKKQS